MAEDDEVSFPSVGDRIGLPHRSGTPDRSSAPLVEDEETTRFDRSGTTVGSRQQVSEDSRVGTVNFNDSDDRTEGEFYNAGSDVVENVYVRHDATGSENATASFISDAQVREMLQNMANQTAMAFIRNMQQERDERQYGRGYNNDRYYGQRYDARSTSSAPPFGPWSQRPRDNDALGVTGTELESGLEILHRPRTEREAANVRILSKHERGYTQEARLKRKKVATAPLTDKLACSNVLSLLTSESLDEDALVKDNQNWQTSIRGLQMRLREHDMLGPFKIPTTFLDDGTVIEDPFRNLFDDQSITEDEVRRWQRVLLRKASQVDVESDQWAEILLDGSMTATLKQLVLDDFEELAEDERGAVTMAFFMVRNMRLSNQESIDGLQEWVRTFTILKFSGQNVNTACSHVRAVIKTLDSIGEIPANAMRCILDGFAAANTEEFKALCVQLAAADRSSVIRTNVEGMSMRKKIFSVLKDLDQTYRDLKAGHRWRGVSHDGAAYSASLSTDDAQALAARRQLPYDLWVKRAKCHNCGETGHIQKDCPNKPSNSPADKSKDASRFARGSQRGGQRNDQRQGFCSKRQREMERKAKKVYNAVLQQIQERDLSDDDEQEDKTSPRANLAAAHEDDDGSVSDSSVGSLTAQISAMYAALKE